MNEKKRRRYDSEFKRNAIALSEEPGRSAHSVEQSLGIIELISFINSKEPYIDNENKIVHGNLLNVFESKNIPDYYKEEFFGCYLVFLADQGMYDEINSFIV